MEKLYDIRRIGPYVRTHDEIYAEGKVVDGPFHSLDAAAKQAEVMNADRKNENSPPFVAVERLYRQGARGV